MDGLRYRYGKGSSEVGFRDFPPAPKIAPQQEPFKRSPDEGGPPSRLSVSRMSLAAGVGWLSPGNTRYTDIPLSPYRPSLDYQTVPVPAKGGWDRVYLSLGKS